MIKIEVKNNIKFPIDDIKVNLSNELYEVANSVVVPLLKDLIRTSTAVDGSNFPKLEKSTIKKKGNDKQLIDTGLLLNSFKAYREKAGSVIVRIKSGRRDVGSILQNEGVGKRKKKFFFFGITDGMEADCMRKMKSILKRVLKNG